MIPASVVSFKELDRRLAVIDENLVGAELTELEKTEALAEQKAIYDNCLQVSELSSSRSRSLP